MRHSLSNIKIVKKLKKKIDFFKYCSLFSKKKLFFICLLDNHHNYSVLNKYLVSKNFKIKFIQNGLIKKLPYFFHISNFLKGQLFCILKDELKISDYSLIQDLVFEKSHVFLFYLDNRFYGSNKLRFLNKFFKSTVVGLPYLSYFYFLLKLGFILKVEKIKLSGKGTCCLSG